MHKVRIALSYYDESIITNVKLKKVYDEHRFK